MGLCILRLNSRVIGAQGGNIESLNQLAIRVEGGRETCQDIPP